MALKLGLNNFSACLFGLLQTRMNDSKFDLGPKFQGLYNSIFTGFGVDTKFEELHRLDNLVSVRRTVAELLSEIDETTQQAYYLHFAGYGSKSVSD